MNAIDVGRVVVKLMGREAGNKAVITQLIDRNFVEITGPQELSGVRRRRVNINHIEPTEFTVDISRGADDSTVKSAIESDADLKKFMTESL